MTRCLNQRRGRQQRHSEGIQRGGERRHWWKQRKNRKRKRKGWEMEEKWGKEKKGRRQDWRVVKKFLGDTEVLRDPFDKARRKESEWKRCEEGIVTALKKVAVE